MLPLLDGGMIAKNEKFFSASNFWASEPSGSSKANEREDSEPSLYEDGAFTHEGHWVIVSGA